MSMLQIVPTAWGVVLNSTNTLKTIVRLQGSVVKPDNQRVFGPGIVLGLGLVLGLGRRSSKMFVSLQRETPVENGL